MDNDECKEENKEKELEEGRRRREVRRKGR